MCLWTDCLYCFGKIPVDQPTCPFGSRKQRYKSETQATTGQEWKEGISNLCGFKASSNAIRTLINGIIWKALLSKGMKMWRFSGHPVKPLWVYCTSTSLNGSVDECLYLRCENRKCQSVFLCTVRFNSEILMWKLLWSLIPCQQLVRRVRFFFSYFHSFSHKHPYIHSLNLFSSMDHQC